MTNEQKEKMLENLRLAREKKAAKAEASTTAEPVHPEPKPQQSSDQDLGDLVSLVQQLKAELDELKLTRSTAPAPPTVVQGMPQVQPDGALTGVFEKYVLDPKYYPNPTSRLAQESKLARFAFPMNYELSWAVMPTFYKNINGINVQEPRFIVELNRIMLDDESGEDTGGRYTIRSFVFHEDPQAAIEVARLENFDFSKLTERDFLDEMRYLRIRSWLLEAFYPPKRDAEKKVKKEMVVGGKIVQYFEVSSPNGSAIPFKDLDGSKL